MPTTPLGAPYPPGTGVPPNVPLWLQQLAEWADGKIGPLQTWRAQAEQQIAGALQVINEYLDVPVVDWDASPGIGWATAETLTATKINAKMAAFNGGRVTRTSSLNVSGGNPIPFLSATAAPVGMRPFEVVRVPGLQGISGNLSACQITFNTDGLMEFTPYDNGTIVGAGDPNGNFVLVPPFVYRTAQ